jgi:hypothetical protein
VGFYLGVVPPTCILVLNILWLVIVIDGKIHRLMCADIYSLIYSSSALNPGD